MDSLDLEAGSPAEEPNLTALTVDIVTAYVSRNHIQVPELPALIREIHTSLKTLGEPVAATEPSPEKPTPAQIRKSIQQDGLISFIDGKRYQTLKRHLAGHGLDIQTYRARYGLPADYPSTAPAYSERRSELARSLGLGHQRHKSVTTEAPEAASPAAEPAPSPPRGRAKKGVAE